ncbi:MAG: FHA domain-containing protein [Aggregatilineales bacterium]
MVAFACIKCGHINPYDAQYCQNCGTVLPNIHPDPRRTTINTTTVSTDVPVAVDSRRKVNQTAHLGKLNPRSIALYINGCGEPLIAVLDSRLVLGRAKLTNTQTLIDLSPFGAREKGVSRQHCNLQRNSNCVMAQDMGSYNGTWIEGVPLQPYQPTPVTSGARLWLALLELEIYLPE